MAKILIVEDNEQLHRMYRRQLRDHDLQIVVNGLKALELLEEGQYDLVISDGELEGPLTGVDIWEWVRAHRQDLLPKFILCSGSIEIAKFAESKGIKFNGKDSDLFPTITNMLEASP